MSKDGIVCLLMILNVNTYANVILERSLRANEGHIGVNESTVPLETMGPFAANLPRSIRGFDLRFHLGKTSSNRNKNLGFT